MEKELICDYTLNDLKEMSFIVATHFKDRYFEKEDIDKFVEEERERGKKKFEKIMANLDSIDKILDDGSDLNDVEKKSIGGYLNKHKNIN